MKRRRGVAYVLIVVCMVMLTAAVFPHHHHFNFICLQHDWANYEQTCNCCCGGEEGEATACHHSLPDGCEEGCVTRFHCSVPSSGTDVLPCFPLITLLYSIADVLKFGLPDERTGKRDFIYIESLHSLTIQRTDGLRAPPCA